MRLTRWEGGGWGLRLPGRLYLARWRGGGHTLRLSRRTSIDYGLAIYHSTDRVWRGFRLVRSEPDG